jgi:hypothetical protein
MDVKISLAYTRFSRNTMRTGNQGRGLFHRSGSENRPTKFDQLFWRLRFFFTGYILGSLFAIAFIT